VLWQKRSLTFAKRALFIGFVVVVTTCATVAAITTSAVTQIKWVDNRDAPGGPLFFQTQWDAAGAASFVISTWFTDALMASA
jgi:hypothetical protein